MPTGRSCVWIAALVLSLPAIAPAQPIAVLWYFVPTFESQPTGIAAGPDGALWFTEVLGNKIGRITSAGAITEYPLPTAGSEPNGIAAGPDGALWFAEGVADRIGRTPLTERSPSTRIGRITTVGIVTRYPVPTADSIPYWIAAGPDGALWFTENGHRGNRIGRITTAGVVTEYPVLAPILFT